MRIAFHTPLNVPDDGRISGDRRMAGQLTGCLRRLGHDIIPISDARSYLTTPDPGALARLRQHAAQQADALLAGWRQGGAPELWFTYHSYYKAPDLLGPPLCKRLAIPYVVAEASDSERRAEGEWAAHVALARESFGTAALHLCFTGRDRQGVEPWCGPATRILDFPPFIDLPGRAPRPRAPAAPPRLVTVAMMRPGVKHESYLALARSLDNLAGRDWTLTIIGDGPLRPDVEAAFGSLAPGRVTWRGALPHDAVMAEVAGHDILVWPGIGEAYGLVYLEAQAMGLPVVAYASGGVPATVRDGETALLVAEGDEAALAEALARLLDDPALLETMARAAAAFVRAERSGEAAGRLLEHALAQICGTRTPHR